MRASSRPLSKCDAKDYGARDSFSTPPEVKILFRNLLLTFHKKLKRVTMRSVMINFRVFYGMNTRQGECHKSVDRAAHDTTKFNLDMMFELVSSLFL